MIKLGEIQKLEIIRDTTIGLFLNCKEDKNKEDILLPKNVVPEGVEIGDEIEVFVYRDSEDRLIATTRKPKITLGELAFLKVVDVTRIGAFLDWGLEKDLFLPFKEQKFSVEIGKKYLVGLYIDKSDRLCATMRVYKLLSNESPYHKDDTVKATVCNVNKDIGAFVAVDNKYYGLVPKDELYVNLTYGSQIEARVTKVKEDGKLDLSLRKKAYKQRDNDSKVILEKLKENNGVLLLNDKSDPKDIRAQLKMSKNEFKRAVGKLLKQGEIKFCDNGIELINK